MLLIEIICYVTIILAVPIFYGELLASYLFKNNKDRVYHVYLGISFSLGISLLFIISFVIHMLFPISEEYRKYIVIILLVILPISMILIRNKYYRCFIKYNHDHFWLLWGGVFFISWLASLFPYVYPGLIKTGLGDHIEYIAIAKNLYLKSDYCFNYMIFDFYQSDYILDMAKEKKCLPVVNRLPLLPLVTTLFIYLFPIDATGFVFSIILFCFALFVVPIVYYWSSLYFKQIGTIIPDLIIRIVFAIVLPILLSTEFLIGFVESITIIYLALLFVILQKKISWYQCVALFLCFIMLFFSKGEGAIALLFAGVFFVFPLLIKRLLINDTSGTFKLVVLGICFLSSIISWYTYASKYGANNNFSFSVYEESSTGSLQVKKDGFIDFLEKEYSVTINNLNLTYTYHDNYPYLSVVERLNLEEHLSRIKNNSGSIFFYNYMLGAQSNGSSFNIKPDKDTTSELYITMVYSIVKNIWNRFKSVLLENDIVVLLMIILVIIPPLLLFSNRAIFAQYLMLHISFFLLLNLLNSGAVYFDRFMGLFFPYVLSLALIPTWFIIRSFMKTELYDTKKTRITSYLLMIGILVPSFIAQSKEIHKARIVESDLAEAVFVIKKYTGTEAMISTSLPQYISALTDRYAIGHADNIHFLTLQIDSFSPSHILINNRPDWFYSEYEVFAKYYRLGGFSEYDIIYDNPEKHILLLKKT